MKKKKQIAIFVVLLCILSAICGAAVMYYSHYDNLDTDEFTLSGYRHLTVTMDQKKEVSDEEVEEAIIAQLEEKDIFEKITDAKIQKGDMVNISFQGYLDGKKAKSDMAGEDYDLEVGSNTFVTGFEDGLIGQKPGKTIKLKLTFPDSYTNENYAGHKVKFIVKINYIKKNYTKDTLTDDIVQENTEYDSVEALYEGEKTVLEKEVDSEFEEAKKEAVWKKLLEDTDVKQYNESYIEEESKAFDQTYENHAKSLNITLEEFITNYCNYTMEEYESLQEQSAKEAALKHMVAEAIAEHEHRTADSYEQTLANVEELLLETTQFQYK
jgi:trigger factor